MLVYFNIISMQIIYFFFFLFVQFNLNKLNKKKSHTKTNEKYFNFFLVTLQSTLVQYRFEIQNLI